MNVWVCVTGSDLITVFFVHEPNSGSPYGMLAWWREQREAGGATLITSVCHGGWAGRWDTRGSAQPVCLTFPKGGGFLCVPAKKRLKQDNDWANKEIKVIVIILWLSSSPRPFPLTSHNTFLLFTMASKYILS